MAGLLAPPYGVMETGSNNDSKWKLGTFCIEKFVVWNVFSCDQKIPPYTSLTDEVSRLFCG